MNDRYIVDKRVGCIAVIDTHHPSYPSGPGLHAEYPEVIKYWGGLRRKGADLGVMVFRSKGGEKHGCPWYLSGGTILAARRLAQKLNFAANALLSRKATDTAGQND